MLLLLGWALATKADVVERVVWKQSVPAAAVLLLQEQHQ